MVPLGGTDCNNISDDNNKQLHSPDDTGKCVSNINDIETMNNLNTTGPQLDDIQPVISETKGIE